MKKILLLIISLILVVSTALTLSGCKKKNKGNKGPDEVEKSYTLDSSAFDSLVVFGEELSLNGLKLIEAGGETVEVTADMVSGIDTSSAGTKELTVSYNGQSFKVNYSVKFRIVFVVNGEETVQLVTDVTEITVPDTPKITGKQFDCWSEQLPNVLVSNMRIDAVYKTLSSDREDAYSWTGAGVINLEGYADDASAVRLYVTDSSGNEIDQSLASVDAAAGKINYTLGSGNVIVIAISGTGVMDKSWKITRIAEPAFIIASGQQAVAVAFGSNRLSQKISSTAASVGFKYSARTNNDNVSAAASMGYLFIDNLKAGVTEITVRATNATNELEYIEIKQYAVVTPELFQVANDKTEYGIEDIWTVGGVNTSLLPKLSAYAGSADRVGAGFFENVSYSASDARVVISPDGSISVNGTAPGSILVDVQAVFSYAEVRFTSSVMKLRCVFDGVNVYSYNELYAETVKDNPRPIVLQKSIKEDFSATNHVKIKSTYDTTYYDNLNMPESSKMINVLMQFKNDVFGNGFEINAHNATLGMLGSTGMPKEESLFKGPLNFVAMAQSGGAISVKGQDNIVFAVYEGVTLNNVELKGCDLSAVDGKSDLNELTYAGTTVEILGDNVTIEYSRLMNGRTVLRVFGDEKDPNKEINLYVKNTVIKGSREFNARIGSNKFYTSATEASPNLPGDSGSDYNTKKKYDSLSAAQKAAYDEKYINTFVTFENVVFEDAGIFSIGVDSHFAGNFLRDASTTSYRDLLNGWKDLAKTSYGAKVTLKGDVRLYSWKPLDDINSDTLIENNLPKNNDLSRIAFNVKDLVKSYSNSASFLYKHDGKDYVHTGIAFFGGGKNYGVVENAITSSFNHTLNTLEVTLREVGQGFLENAAGSQPFYFMIYGANSTFTYKTQLEMTDKYSCLHN